jgi:hypothetical protein
MKSDATRFPGLNIPQAVAQTRKTRKNTIFSMPYAHIQFQLSLFRKYPVQLIATLRLNTQPCEQPFRQI